MGSLSYITGLLSSLEPSRGIPILAIATPSPPSSRLLFPPPSTLSLFSHFPPLLSVFPLPLYSPLAQQICSLFNHPHGCRVLSSSGLLSFPLSMYSISKYSSHRSLTLMPMSIFSTLFSSDVSGRGPLERFLSSTRPSQFLPHNQRFLLGPRRST